jgi:archaellum component FlaG (FlaF/FlaG flagellin family)
LLVSKILMNFYKKYFSTFLLKQFICINFFLFIILNNIVAQEIKFTASASATKVGLQNQFQITFKLSGSAGSEKFQLPDLKNFNIVGGPMQSSSFSSINGSTSSSKSYTYYLQAKATGTFTIASATAIIDGKAVQSNAIKIEVVNGSIQSAQPKVQPNPLNDILGTDPFGNPIPKSKKDKKSKQVPVPKTAPANSIFTEANLKDKVFAKIDVNKTSAFIGEEITVEYNIYTQLPMEAGIRKLNSPEGFWTQEYNEVDNSQANDHVQINGKMYRKYTLRKVALFPTKEGVLTIPSIDLESSVQVHTQEPMETNDHSIAGLINSLFVEENIQKVPVQLTIAPVTIQAKALPSVGRPENFNGTVGKYTLESDIDRTELSTDDASALTFTIRGTGNIKMIAKPEINFTGDIETFDPSTFDTVTNFLNEISGYKCFKYLLQPRNAGDFQIPAASFTYFDLDTKTYKTLSSNEYLLKVKPGTKNKSISKLHGLPKDIHDIVNDDTMKKNIQEFLPEKPVYWMGYAMPLITLLGLNIYKKKRDTDISNAKLFINTDAHQIAVQRMSIAQEMLKEQNQNGFYNETNKAIWLYLSDKLNIPLSKLNKEETWQYLQNKNVDVATFDNIIATTQQCEEALYTSHPNLGDMQNVYENATAIISNLENQIG